MVRGKDVTKTERITAMTIKKGAVYEEIRARREKLENSTFTFGSRVRIWVTQKVEEDDKRAINGRSVSFVGQQKGSVDFALILI
jgi:hypothetical protein